MQLMVQWAVTLSILLTLFTMYVDAGADDSAELCCLKLLPCAMLVRQHVNTT